jgi:hypothetical protein
MPRIRIALSVGTLLALGLFAHTTTAQSSQKKLQPYPLWNFDEQGHSCRAKGRLQDRDYCNSHLMDRIVTGGKDAIPVLISQLRDTRPTKEPIYDFWSRTTTGDIAYFILTDLFTDSDWKTFNMPDLESLNDKKCDSNAEDCWQRFLKSHGRKFVQDQWSAAWKKNKERVYWNEEARCFRLQPESKLPRIPGNQ